MAVRELGQTGRVQRLIDDSIYLFPGDEVYLFTGDEETAAPVIQEVGPDGSQTEPGASGWSISHPKGSSFPPCSSPAPGFTVGGQVST